MPDPPKGPPYRPGIYPDGPNRMQRVALGLFGPSCVLVAGALFTTGIAGALEFAIGFLTAGVGVTWRAVHVERRYRASRRSPNTRSRAA